MPLIFIVTAKTSCSHYTGLDPRFFGSYVTALTNFGFAPIDSKGLLMFFNTRRVSLMKMTFEKV